MPNNNISTYVGYGILSTCAIQPCMAKMDDYIWKDIHVLILDMELKVWHLSTKNKSHKKLNEYWSFALLTWVEIWNVTATDKRRHGS